MSLQPFSEWLEESTVSVGGRLYTTPDALARCHTAGRVVVIAMCPRHKWHSSDVLCAALICPNVLHSYVDMQRVVLITDVRPSTSLRSHT